MQILLWLVPPVVVTGVAMVWVSWLGREGRGRVGREEAARRIGVALEREPRVSVRTSRPRVDTEPSSGVAVRRPAEPRPDLTVPAAPAVAPAAKPAPVDRPRRLAS